MTRDEAIQIVSATAFVEKQPGIVELIIPPAPFVDALVALGVLKLDEPLAAKKGDPAFIMHVGSQINRATPVFYKDGSWWPLRQTDAESNQTPPRCEPPPEHREKRWHWLRDHLSNLSVGLWLSDAHLWSIRCGTLFTDGAPDKLAEKGWRYVAPCEEPKTGA